MNNEAIKTEGITEQEEKPLTSFEKQEKIKENLVLISNLLNEIRSDTKKEIENKSKASLSSRDQILFNKIDLGRLNILDAQLDFIQGDFENFNPFKDTAETDKMAGKILQLGGLKSIFSEAKTIAGENNRIPNHIFTKLSSLVELEENTKKLLD
ncbi:MAG: hypothetical protein WCF92_03200 [bacterium]